MFKLMKLLLLLLTFYTFANCSSPTAKKINIIPKASSDKHAVLSVLLELHHRIIFNTPSDPLDFNNYTSKDSMLTKIIEIDKPEHIFYSFFTEKNVHKVGNILLLPGDSIVLRDNGFTVAYSTGFQKYINNFITVPEKALPTINFNMMLVNAKSIFDKNKNAIANLPMDEKMKDILRNFNHLIKAYQIIGFRFEKEKYNKLMLDSLYNDLLSQVFIIESLNSPFSSEVYYNIIRYNAFKKDIAINDFWTYFDKVDSTISHSSFYNPYMISCIKGNYRNNYQALLGIAAKLKRIESPSKLVDTLSALTNILLKTKTDYAEAKKELNQYAGGKFSSFMEETDISHNQQRAIQSLAPDTLLDVNNKKSSLQEAIFSGNANIIVLDFWASWCVPCIADYPYLEKTEELLKDEPIKFLNISIDNEEDSGKWISRMKQLKIYKAPNQYRLANKKNSPLKDFFNMSTIPRYIVIDKTGKILNENFDRPNESSFQRKLEAYLSEFKK